MNEREETQFEAQLREHFAARLDPQLGKSAGRFMQEFGAAVTPRMRLVGEASAPRPAHRPLRLIGWSAGITSLAVAAGIAAVMVLSPLLMQHTQPVAPNGNGIALNDSAVSNSLPAESGADTPDTNEQVPTVDDQAPVDVEHALSWNTVDQGTVYLPDGVPVRSVVRQASETMKWYDPQRQAHIQMTVPRSEVMLVGYQSQ